VNDHSAHPASADDATIVDARGTLCPQPVIDLARVADDLPAGARVRVLADDPAARFDVAAWCRMRGHQLAGIDEQGGALTFTIVLGAKAQPAASDG
jgi:TusA-related sulfurtransferase